MYNMLPPNEVCRDLVARYAHVLATCGEAFEGAELVTPTAEHFPDHFARDGKSLARLLERVVSYTPLGEDVPLGIVLVEDAGLVSGDDGHCTSGCRSGSSPQAGTPAGQRVDGVQKHGDGYRIALPVTELGNPTRLVCALARGVSAAVLGETGDDVLSKGGREVAAASEVIAVASGFGVVLLEGSHVYAKACGGPSIHQGTALSPSELAVLVAIFCAVNDVSPRVVRKHLGATQAEAFDEAAAFVAKNGEVVRKLREAPELLETGVFTFEERRGLLARLLTQTG